MWRPTRFHVVAAICLALAIAHIPNAAYALIEGGKLTDLATDNPVAGRIQLQRVEMQRKGPHRHTVVATVETDEKGDWVLKKTPVGWHRVVAFAEGYTTRVIGYGRFDDRPQLHAYNLGLAPAVFLSGLIVDEGGKPLRGVEVRLSDVVSVAGERYQSNQDYLGKQTTRVGLRSSQSRLARRPSA